MSLYTRKMGGAPSLALNVAQTYRISLQRSGEGPSATWVAEVDGLPHCTARGATADEALRRAWANANEATGLSEVAHGSAVETTAGAPRHSGRLLVRMPATLHDELAQLATTEGVSLNQLITATLAAAARWRAGEGQRSSAVSGSPEDGAGSVSSDTWLTPRVLGLALVANVVVLLLAAVAAIALVIVAWQSG